MMVYQYAQQDMLPLSPGQRASEAPGTAASDITTLQVSQVSLLGGLHTARSTRLGKGGGAGAGGVSGHGPRTYGHSSHSSELHMLLYVTGWVTCRVRLQRHWGWDWGRA